MGPHDSNHHFADITAELRRDRHVARRAALFQAMTPATAPPWAAIGVSFGLLMTTMAMFLVWTHWHSGMMLTLTVVLFCCVMLPIARYSRRRPASPSAGRAHRTV